MTPGFRRRILIEPGPGRVSAELEDDWHRMVVTLVHRDGLVAAVESEMKRRPWTTCPGAMDQLKTTFTGHALADFARRGEKTSNCTHLHDLALFAAGHAEGREPIAYEVLICDPVDGVSEARLWRNGELALHWTLEKGRIAAPSDLAGRKLGELGDWIAAQDRAGAEAGRILRWASIMSNGRAMDIPAGLAATTFPLGACYTFQPAIAAVGVRVADADKDFSVAGMEPMADRSAAFRISV